jgi:hypothetical protein
MTFNVNKDKVFNNTYTTSVLKIPIYSSIIDVGDEPGMEGDIIIDSSTGEFCYNNGYGWVCMSMDSIENVGTGEDIYNVGTMYPFQLRTIQGAFNQAVPNLIAEDVIVNDPTTNPTPATNGNVIGTQIQNSLVVYLNTTGSDSNDGVTLLTSVATIERALEIVRFRSYVNNARIIFGPGVYNLTNNLLNFQIGNRGREKSPLFLEGSLITVRSGNAPNITVNIDEYSLLQFINIAGAGFSSADEGRMIRLTYTNTSSGIQTNDFILGEYNSIDNTICLCASINGYQISPSDSVVYTIFDRSSIINMTDSIWISDNIPIIFKNLVFEFSLDQPDITIEMQNFTAVNINTEYRHSAGIIDQTNEYTLNYVNCNMMSGKLPLLTILPLVSDPNAASAGMYIHLDNNPTGSNNTGLFINNITGQSTYQNSFIRGSDGYETVININNIDSLLVVVENNIINLNGQNSIEWVHTYNNNIGFMAFCLYHNVVKTMSLNNSALNVFRLHIDCNTANLQYPILIDTNSNCNLEDSLIEGNNNSYIGGIEVYESTLNFNNSIINSFNSVNSDPDTAGLYAENSNIIIDINNVSAIQSTFYTLPNSAILCRKCNVTISHTVSNAFITDVTRNVNSYPLILENCQLNITSNNANPFITNIGFQRPGYILLNNCKGSIESVRIFGNNNTLSEVAIDANNSILLLNNILLDNLLINRFNDAIIKLTNSTVNLNNSVFNYTSIPSYNGINAINSKININTISFTNFIRSVNLVTSELRINGKISVNNCNYGIYGQSSLLDITSISSDPSVFTDNTLSDLYLVNTNGYLTECNFINNDTTAIILNNNSQLRIEEYVIDMITGNTIAIDCTNSKLVLNSGVIYNYENGIVAKNSELVLTNSDLNIPSVSLQTGLVLDNSNLFCEDTNIFEHNNSIIATNNSQLVIKGSNISNLLPAINGTTIIVENSQATITSDTKRTIYHKDLGMKLKNANLYILNYELSGLANLSPPGTSSTNIDAESSHILIEHSVDLIYGNNTDNSNAINLLNSDLVIKDINAALTPSTFSISNQVAGNAFDLINSSLTMENSTNINSINDCNRILTSTNSKIIIDRLNTTNINSFGFDCTTTYLRLDNASILHDANNCINANGCQLELSNSTFNGTPGGVVALQLDSCQFNADNVTTTGYSSSSIIADNSTLNISNSTLDGFNIGLEISNSKLKLIRAPNSPITMTSNNKCIFATSSKLLVQNYNFEVTDLNGICIDLQNSNINLVSGNLDNTIVGQNGINAINSNVSMNQVNTATFWRIENTSSQGNIAINLDQSVLNCNNSFDVQLFIRNYILGINAINNSNLVIRRLNAFNTVAPDPVTSLNTVISLDSSKLVLRGQVGQLSQLSSNLNCINAINNSQLEIIYMLIIESPGGNGINLANSDIVCDNVTINSCQLAMSANNSRIRGVTSTFTNSTLSNISLVKSSISLTDCIITNASNLGVTGITLENSDANINNTNISSNFNGMLVSRNSSATLTGNTVGLNTNTGLIIGSHSNVNAQPTVNVTGSVNNINLAGTILVTYPASGNSINDYILIGPALSQMCNITVG